MNKWVDWKNRKSTGLYYRLGLLKIVATLPVPKPQTPIITFIEKGAQKTF